MKKITLTICLLALFTAVNVSAKNYYKWVDDKGATHFTLEQPKDRATKTVSTHAGSSSIYDPSKANAKADESRKDESEIEKIKTTEKKLAAAQDRECKKAQSQLQTLNERARVRMKNKDGSNFIMSPEEKYAKTKELKNYIASECPPK
jgi:hypothetical protein